MASTVLPLLGPDVITKSGEVPDFAPGGGHNVPLCLSVTTIFTSREIPSLLVLA
jgi:hypothetical protein